MNTDGTAGTPSIFVTGINGPDGIAVKRTGTNAGSIWVTANQSDEIVIIDNVTGRVIDKFGDFFGLEAPPGMQCPPTCLPNGLLFPASLAFSSDERTLYVANPAFAQSPPDPASIDTAWAQRVTHWNVVRTTTTFNPPLSQTHKKARKGCGDTLQPPTPVASGAHSFGPAACAVPWRISSQSPRPPFPALVGRGLEAAPPALPFAQDDSPEAGVGRSTRSGRTGAKQAAFPQVPFP